MAGHFAETIFARGRRLTVIPEKLEGIFQDTYTKGEDYVVQGREEDPDAQEVVRYGKIYAKRKGLSFRYAFTQDARLRFRVADKRPYVKKDLKYWGTP